MRLYITILITIFISLISLEKLHAGPNEAGTKITISGNITDKETGEDLIGATVFVKELQNGTSSNVYGFYSISLEKGDYTLIFSYIGYEQLEKTVQLKEDFTLNIELESTNQELEEVVVSSTALNDNVTRTTMSTIKMDAKTINKIPALMGEVDIIKAIMLLPGVQTIAEGSSGFSVRGGSMDQNLIQLDEATVYNASHLMGFFSVFNNDAIKGVELYKGDIPASSGGRLSSLLDVRMRDGNIKKFSGRGGIGTISSRLTLEGPILKDKASFLISGRRTYADIFIRMFGRDEIKDSRIYFYDFNTKFNYRINNNNRIFISGYYGRDIFKNSDFKMGWGNQTTSVRWNHLFSKKLFTNFTFLYSNFDYELGVPEGQSNSFEWKSNLKDYSGKADFTFYLNSKNTIKFGLSSIYHKFKPGTAKGLGEESIATELVVQNNQALESGVYISNEQKIGSRFTFKYGLRFSHFVNVGETNIYNYDENYKPIDSTNYGNGEFFSPYYGLEPRFGAVFLLNEVSSVKASYSRTRQYVHLGQNSTAGTPFDVWFPSSPNVKPQLADQFALGYFRNFLDNSIEGSVEVYYKKMQNSIDFKDHAELLLNQYFEGELRFGNAEAYGIEFLAKYHLKKFNGWVSYTLSKVTKTIDEINDGNPYPAVYDKPHNISIIVNYSLNKRLDLGATWVYNTGSAVTFPTGRFVYGNTVVPIYSTRNGYRLPDYHRLDVSATWKSKEKPGRKWSYEWNFSVYNAYGRKNPWVINFKEEPTDPNKTYAEMIYLFSFVPAITFNFLF
ncbi:MAG: hypothetical protein DRJ05_08485 [Bacteroidetes bacterium]|nr:MAG: hypothetical protein DRJ05_08485 [Bacteroidota bacterium]